MRTTVVTYAFNVFIKPVNQSVARELDLRKKLQMAEAEHGVTNLIEQTVRGSRLRLSGHAADELRHSAELHGATESKKIELSEPRGVAKACKADLTGCGCDPCSWLPAQRYSPWEHSTQTE